MRFVFGALLALIGLGCSAGPVGVDPKLVERPSEIQALEDELAKRPHEIGLYQRLIEHDLRVGDFKNARATAYHCVDLNKRNWQAWMVAAEAHRTLLSLRECEDALKQAIQLAPADEVLPSNALASFYEEVGDREAMLALRRKMAKAWPTNENLIALHIAELTGGADTRRRESARNAIVPTSISEALLAGRPVVSVEIPKARALSKETKADALALFRLVSVVENRKQLAEPLRSLLETQETKDVRFAALFGLWQLELFDSQENPIVGPSPEVAALSRRLNQIDDAHPMWLVRQFQVASLWDDEPKKARLQAKLQELGISEPFTADSFAHLARLWSIEDASRLGLLEYAIHTLEKFVAGEAQPAFFLQHAHLEIRRMNFARGREILESLLARGDQSTIGDAAKLELAMARIKMGEAMQVQAELESLAESEEVWHTSTASLAWLRALLDYHLHSD